MSGLTDYDPENVQDAIDAVNTLRRGDRAIGVQVVGPPSSGKSTFVDLVVAPHDVVLDIDEFHRALAGRCEDGHPSMWRGSQNARRLAVDLWCEARNYLELGDFFDAGCVVWLVSTRLSREGARVTLQPRRESCRRRILQRAINAGGGRGYVRGQIEALDWYLSSFMAPPGTITVQGAEGGILAPHGRRSADACDDVPSERATR